MKQTYVNLSKVKNGTLYEAFTVEKHLAVVVRHRGEIGIFYETHHQKMVE